MANRRYMVSQQQIAAAADKCGSESGINYDALSGIYEEGMQKVLRQIARTHLKFEYEHGGAGYEKSAMQADKVEALFAQLMVDLPEELQVRLFDLQSEVGYRELEGMDAGYIAGFLAGYRFLNELSPDAGDRQTEVAE